MLNKKIISESNRIRNLMGLRQILEGFELETFPVQGGKFNIGYDKNWSDFDNPESTANSDFSYSPTYAGAGGHLKGHIGIDIFGPKGAPIVAPVTGEVKLNFSNGNTVIIQDMNGYNHWLGHLDSISPEIKDGNYVFAGTEVGKLGNTGNAAGTAPHLHYNVYKSNYYDAQDPFEVLKSSINKKPTEIKVIEPPDDGSWEYFTQGVKKDEKQEPSINLKLDTKGGADWEELVNPK